MAVVSLVNTNPVSPVDVPLLGRTLEYGETFEVDESIAGRPPSGTPGDENYDPGDGLLAQVGNYALPTPATPAPSPVVSDPATPQE